jgi:hypothetical protein
VVRLMGTDWGFDVESAFLLLSFPAPPRSCTLVDSASEFIFYGNGQIVAMG